MDRMLQEGIITGWEKYADTNQEVLLYGVEDQTLYQDNFKQLYHNISYYDFIMDLAKNVKKILKVGTEALYSDTLIYLEKKRSLYESGDLSFEKWVRLLLNEKNKIELNFNTPNLDLIEEMRNIKQGID
ncbi:MAG: hypothetical protein GY830_10655 [Bacteroidetes bacterium]|nr:hypothetical protein [Bacteroidota bacterium]